MFCGSLDSGKIKKLFLVNCLHIPGGILYTVSGQTFDRMIECRIREMPDRENK